MTLALELALLLALAWLLARGAALVRLPPLLGMILAGVGVAALPWQALHLDGPVLDDISGPVRLGVLALVLLRAGLGITPTELREAGPAALRMGLLPLAGDVLLVCLSGHWLLGLAWGPALVLGLVVGAISPAIAIPGLMDLLRGLRGEARRAPTALLAGAPLDNIAAVVTLGLVLDLVLEGEVGWHALTVDLPWTLAAGIACGIAAGAVVGGLLRSRPELARSRAFAATAWALGGALVWLGSAIGASFVLAVLALGITVRSAAPEAAEVLSSALAEHWRWARYLLFSLIGYAVHLGPLASIGLAAAAVIALGQLGRAAGSWLASTGTGWTPRERLSAILCYLPKATIQAAFASVPLDRGLPGGEVILGVGVLAILLTAPVGVLALYRGAGALLGSRPDPEGVRVAHLQ